MNKEELEELGQGVQIEEIYKFVGPNKTYLYTSARVPVLYDGQQYEPMPGLSRGNVKVESDITAGGNLSIKISTKSEVIKDYAFDIMPQSLRVKITRIYIGTGQVRSIWSGYVSGFSVDAEISEIISSSLLSNMAKKSIPTHYFQSPCGHVLYDEGCKMKREDNIAQGQVQSLTEGNLKIVCSDYSPFAPTGFKAGEVVNISTSERRMIVDANDAEGWVQVNYPFTTLKIGDTIELARGCDHSFEGDCKNKFDNQENYGGFPLIPILNLFDGRVD